MAATIRDGLLHEPRFILRSRVAMHEMSIVQTLLEQIESEVERSGHTGRILSVHLVVGRLSGVHVDSLRFAFELLSPDTAVGDAELTIDQPRAELACQDCHTVHPTDELASHCPNCGSAHVLIQGGQQLLLQSIELEDESQTSGGGRH